MQHLLYVCPSCRRALGSQISSRNGNRMVQTVATAASAPEYGTSGNYGKHGGKWQRKQQTVREARPTRPLIRNPLSRIPITKPIPGKSAYAIPSTASRSPGRPLGYHARDVFENGLARLEAAIKKSPEQVADIWKQFGRLLRDFNVPNQLSLLILLQQHNLPRLLLRNLTENQHTIPGLPSPRDVLITYADYGIKEDHLWADVMFSLVRLDFYGEVMDLWRDLLQIRQSDMLSEVDPDFGESGTAWQLKDTSFVLDTPFEIQAKDPRYYPAAAALTAFLYSRKLDLLQTKFVDLLHFLAPRGTSIMNLIAPTAVIEGMLKEHNIRPHVIEHVVSELKRFRPYSVYDNETRSTILDQVLLAASQNNVERIRRLYANSQVSSQNAKASSKPGTTPFIHNPSFYMTFVNAYYQCNSVGDATDVWKDMVKANIKPSLSAWGARLDGCAKVKDKALFENEWKSMLEEGMEPDHICWTIRMQMYFSIGELDEAKSCLQTMSDKGIKINAHTINVAIAGLNNKKLYDDAADLLKWATGAGIKPDVITYNLIADARVRENDFAAVGKTIGLMKEQGVQPDIITYGLVLRGMYTHAREPPSLKKIKDIIEEMRSAGIEPNLQFYVTIIHGMLNRFNDIQGAMSIISAMPHKAWQASAYTSSVLIGYCARTNNINGVEEIWRNMLRERIIPDSAVYNSTIIAFAMAGKKDRMMDILMQMVRERKKPTMGVFVWVLRCLLKYGDLAMANEVVRDIPQLEKFEKNAQLNALRKQLELLQNNLVWRKERSEKES